MISALEGKILIESGPKVLNLGINFFSADNESVIRSRGQYLDRKWTDCTALGGGINMLEGKKLLDSGP